MSAAVIAGLLGVLAPAGVAAAAPEGRIQQIESTPGQVTFLLSAAGLAEGQQVDPESLVVTIGGQEVPATATLSSEAVSADDAPARRAMLVLDTSGSMGEGTRMASAKSAAQAYLAAVPDDVEVGLITFADEATRAVPPTRDRQAVASAIEGLTPSGATALYDATALAVKSLGDEGSRSIVLLSDGKDEGSATSAAKAAKAVAGSGASLDAVSLGAGSQEEQLAALAKAGDGSLVTATDAEALGEAFVAAARSMSSQLAVTVEVPADATAGTKELAATVDVDGQPVTDKTIAEVQPAAADPAAFGPRAVETDTMWSNPAFMALGIGAVFLALLVIGGLVVNTVDPSRRSDGRIRRRLSGSGAIAEPTRTSTVPRTALGDGATVRNAVAMADKVIHGERSDALENRLQTAGVPLRSSEWVVLHALIAVLTGLAFALLSGVSLGMTLFGLLLGAAGPWLFLSIKASRRQQKFYEQLPDTMQMLAGSLAAGYSLPQGLDAVARDAGGPMGQEIQRALTESRLGVEIEESLQAVATRMQSKDFGWVVMAIAMNRQVGGNLADVLRTVAATLRERERLRRQVKALSAEGKLSAWVLGLLPFGLIGYMAMVNPEYIGLLFSSVIGWMFILGGTVAMAIGLFWMSKLVRIEV